MHHIRILRVSAFEIFLLLMKLHLNICYYIRRIEKYVACNILHFDESVILIDELHFSLYTFDCTKTQKNFCLRKINIRLWLKKVSKNEKKLPNI